MPLTKSKIKIKQNKKATYIDISQENLLADDFIDNFKDYLNSAADFLSGTAVSLIVPSEIKLEETLEEELATAIKKLRDELNNANVALKGLSQTNSEENIDAKFIDPETAQQKQKTQAEIISKLPETLYIKHNLRSGQLVRYPGNIVIIGDVNPEAEVIATGDIIVWGNLRGLAHAGSSGDESSIVTAHKLACGQLRIAAKMIAISSKIHKKFTQNKKSIEPEIARIVDNEIRISRWG